jgi:hypothetical protein
VRCGWGKALIGDGKTDEEGLAIYGRPTTDLLSSRTRLRLRRGVRFTVGGKAAEGKGSRSRAATGPGNGTETGIVGGRYAEGNERRSRVANGPGNGLETRGATDRETLEGARWKVGQQWPAGNGARTGAEHRGVSEQGSRGKPRGGPTDLRIGRNEAQRNEALARHWAFRFRRRLRRVIAASRRWVISAGQNPLAGDAQRRSVSHQSRPRATSRGAGRPRGAVGCAGGTNL